MAWIRNRPTPEGIELGENFARLCGSAIREHEQKFPDLPRPCRSCAFRAGSMPNGCPDSVMTAIKCLAEREPFRCHESTDHPLCAGWAIVSATTDPDHPGTAMPWDFPEGPPEGARPGDTT